MFIHGKGTYASLNSVDLSTYTNKVDFERVADSHDTTTFGKNARTYQGGLLDGTCTLAGIYDDGETGPRPTIEGLLGDVTALVYRPEGTGAGKPEDTVNVLVMSYQESAEVGETIKWTCELQLSGDVTTTDQV